jgi:hypothetical protein
MINYHATHHETVVHETVSGFNCLEEFIMKQMHSNLSVKLKHLENKIKQLWELPLPRVKK